MSYSVPFFSRMPSQVVKYCPAPTKFIKSAQKQITSNGMYVLHKICILTNSDLPFHRSGKRDGLTELVFFRTRCPTCQVSFKLTEGKKN